MSVVEKQLPTQKKLNKEDILLKVKDNLNYIYIILMFFVNFMLSTLKIAEKSLEFVYPKTVMGWLLFIVNIAFSVLLGVLIMNSFRRQGIKIGHNHIKELYDQYIKAISETELAKRPRSLKDYLTQTLKKDTISKSIILVILNVFVASALVTLNLNNVISLITNTVMSIAFGIKTMMDAEDFVISELSLFYKLKLKEIKEKENVNKI